MLLSLKIIKIHKIVMEKFPEMGGLEIGRKGRWREGCKTKNKKVLNIYYIAIIDSEQIKITMNPFKQKSHKPKLTTRFNISMSSRQESNQTHRLHSSKEADENTIRYRNHISFLECRVEQQQATIEKMQCEIQANLNIQAKLNAQVLRLQRTNKNMLDSLYEAENRIRELEEVNNNQMLHQSIEKIQHELNMSQVRKRNRTLEFSENPERANSRTTFNKKSVKTSQRVDSQQPSFKLTSLMNFFKLSSSVYAVNIKPSTDEKAKQKQSQIQQNEKVSKLELAIYSLKKQLREQQKTYEQKIAALVQQHQKASDQKNTRLQEKLMENQTKIGKLLQKLQMKDLEMMEVEERYAKELTEAEQVVAALNENIKDIVQKKQEELDDAYEKLNTVMKKMKELQDSNHRANQELEQMAQSLEKQQEKCQELTDRLALANIQEEEDSEEKQFADMIEVWTQTEEELADLAELKVQDDTMSQLEHSYQEQLCALAEEVKFKTSLLEDQNKKAMALVQQIQAIQSVNEQITEKEYNLRKDFNKTKQQLVQLEETKEFQLRQINKLNSAMRRLEGDLAEKEYIANDLTQQMLIIKQSLTVEKADHECQVSDQKSFNQDEQKEQFNMDELQEHFSMILKEKEQQYNGLQSELEKERALCQHFEKEIEKYCKQIERKQLELQEANAKITELNEVIARHEGELVESKDEISSLRKNVQDLEEKEAFFQDYIQQIKTVDA